MSKQWNPRKKTVELPPAQGAEQAPARKSRIRREPVRTETKEVKPPSPQREAWTVVAGVALFGVATAALAVGFSEITSRRNSAAPPPTDFGHCYNRAGPNCVVDGDTIFIGGQRVEIAGMDAPEIAEARCPRERTRGIEAATRLLELLNRGGAKVTGTERQADGRVLTKVEVDGRDVGAALVNAGVAREYGSGRTSWC